MKLENQVCSLDLAKRLKELGVEQESLFYWRYNDGMDEWFIDEWDEFGPAKEFISDLKATSAFTVAELGEMLPDRTPNQDIDKNLYPYDFVNWPMPCPMNKWKGYIYKANGNIIHSSMTTADTEANARAKMLVSLLENKLTDNQGQQKT